MEKQIKNKILTFPLSENIQEQLEENLNKLGQEGFRLFDCHLNGDAVVAFMQKEMDIDYILKNQESTSVEGKSKSLQDNKFDEFITDNDWT
jgi:predicted esterase YcpF (UPF0227 family)